MSVAFREDHKVLLHLLPGKSWAILQFPAQMNAAAAQSL